MLDRNGPQTPILLSSLFCAIGCFILALGTNVNHLLIGSVVLGLGNVEQSVLSHISVNTARDNRSFIVSGYLIQITVLGIVGKMLYPFWRVLVDVVLQGSGIADDLLNDRITMLVCPVACIFGFFALLVSPLPQNSVFEETTEEANESQSTSGHNFLSSFRCASTFESGLKHFTPFILLALSGLLLSIALTIPKVLWPIFIKDQLSWTSSEYAYLLLFQAGVQSLCMALLSPFEKKTSKFTPILVTSLIAAVVSLVAFSLSPALYYAHIILALLLFGCLSLLEIAIASQASLSVPQALQGSAFGILTLVVGGGRMIGNILGTQLYTSSKISTSLVPYPFLIVSALLVLVWILVYGVSRTSGNGSPRIDTD